MEVRTVAYILPLAFPFLLSAFLSHFIGMSYLFRGVESSSVYYPLGPWLGLRSVHRDTEKITQIVVTARFRLSDSLLSSAHRLHDTMD